MTTADSASPLFDAEALQRAVQQTLATANVPEASGFAAVVDTTGARVGLATRTKSGWTFDADAGYDFSQGWDAGFTIGKHWS